MDVTTTRMNPPSPLKKDWVLTQEAFDRLLLLLDPDREQAGRKYERLRLKLLKFFEWRGSTAPDALADESLNRVARRIDEGQHVTNLDAYSYGVARMVFSESLKLGQREREALSAAPPHEQADDEDPERAARRACFERCLGELPEPSRRLIVEYYCGEGTAKIERRRRLAGALGIQLNALRIRAHRIRLGIEACVRGCVGAPPA